MNVWKARRRWTKSSPTWRRFSAQAIAAVAQSPDTATDALSFSSLRISFALSWKIALVSEAFGAGRGVGKELMYWFQGTRADMMLAWGASFMVLMVLFDALVLRPWKTGFFPGDR